MWSAYRNASFPITTSRLGIGSSNASMGMPAKFGYSDNENSFSSARKMYLQGAFAKQPLTSELDNKKFSTNGYNYLGSRNMQTVTNGKPIPNNASDLYIARKKNLAIARGSTSRSIEEKSFKNSNVNTVNKAKQLCRSSGCVPSKKISQSPHNQGRCC